MALLKVLPFIVCAVAVIACGYYLGLALAILVVILTIAGIAAGIVVLVAYLIWEAWHDQPPK